MLFYSSGFSVYFFNNFLVGLIAISSLRLFDEFFVKCYEVLCFVLYSTLLIITSIFYFDLLQIFVECITKITILPKCLWISFLYRVCVGNTAKCKIN